MEVLHKVDDVPVVVRVIIPHMLQDLHLKHDSTHNACSHKHPRQFTRCNVCLALTSISPCARNRFLFRTILRATCVLVWWSRHRHTCPNEPLPRLPRISYR